MNKISVVALIMVYGKHIFLNKICISINMEYDVFFAVWQNYNYKLKEDSNQNLLNCRFTKNIYTTLFTT